MSSDKLNKCHLEDCEENISVVYIAHKGRNKYVVATCAKHGEQVETELREIGAEVTKYFPKDELRKEVDSEMRR